jgi:hypothetical protein
MRIIIVYGVEVSRLATQHDSLLILANRIWYMLTIYSLYPKMF